MGRSIHHDTAHMDRRIARGLQQCHIAHSGVGATSDLYALLNVEIARIEALGGEALGIELHVADHGLQLAAARHRTDEGHLSEDGSEVAVSVAIQKPCAT